MSTLSRKNFSRVVGFTLLYALVIIVWGAFVRLSGSGDGCGNHWPLCHGQLMPEGDFKTLLQTWIEYFHRLKSGIFGLIVIALVPLAYRLYPKNHAVRPLSYATLGFTLLEAGIGAALVLFGWVDQDASNARKIVGPLHLVNTLALLGSLTALWFFSKKETAFFWPRVKWSYLNTTLFVLVATTGVWASLSRQLYPDPSLWQGFLADFSSDSPWIVRLRALHPLFAFALLPFFWRWAQLVNASKALYLGLVLNILLGFALLTFYDLPVIFKLLHLLTADLVWIGFVWKCFDFDLSKRSA